MTTAFDPIPRSIDELLEPTWLAWALDDIADEDAITAVERLGDSKTLAEKIRFAVTLTDRNGDTRTGQYCVKGHFDGGPDTLAPEAHFYAELSAQVGVRTPHAYYTSIEESTGRAIVVMDDVVGLGGRFLDRARALLDRHRTIQPRSTGGPARRNVGHSGSGRMRVAATEDDRHGDAIPRGPAAVVAR